MRRLSKMKKISMSSGIRMLADDTFFSHESECNTKYINVRLHKKNTIVFLLREKDEKNICQILLDGCVYNVYDLCLRDVG